MDINSNNCQNSTLITNSEDIRFLLLSRPLDYPKQKRTGQGRWNKLLYKWEISESPFCVNGAIKSIRHIVEITKFEGRKEQLLHKS